jgi:hypothetical protein
MDDKLFSIFRKQRKTIFVSSPACEIVLNYLSKMLSSKYFSFFRFFVNYLFNNNFLHLCKQIMSYIEEYILQEKALVIVYTNKSNRIEWKRLII